ncbi:MAG TPA: ROK family protein [Anaerolineaceae bacterium]|nr:ROK family protein [Anaerolineaceae bacterium]HPN54186.1 ROK family protein [Anaerolineaceae bacterium]
MMPIYIGLDIGGTKLMVASADEHGNIIRRARSRTSNSLERDLARIEQMIIETSAGEPIAGMGAAVGGPLDWLTGVVSPLHQPAWRKVPLKSMMEKRWGCPFYVDVDTNVAVLGEYYANPFPISKLLYITLSTGMGGGLLVNGHVYRGLQGIHPEIGHQSIVYRCMNPAGLRCECGIPDCLEALISGNGIRRIYGKPAEKLSPAEWDEVAFNFGQGLRNMVVLYAPDVIRVGGGIAVGGGESFIQKAGQVMRDNVRIVPPPELSLSRLGYDTALRGAIGIAIHGLHD